MKTMYLASVIFAVVSIKEVLAASGGFGVDWNYDPNSNIGPHNWGNYSAKCGGTQQSPVDINTHNVTYTSTLKPLVLGNYHKTLPDTKFKISNSGSSLVVEMTRNGTTEKNPIFIIHNNIAWKFVSLHFHWGVDNTRGSEHSINGNLFANEMHMIHHNTKYHDVTEAVDKDDGLLVWGHFIQVASTTNNTNMDQILRHFQSVQKNGQYVDFTTFPLKSLIPEDSEANYYTYPGSLTTPGCYESVTWVVNNKTIDISQAQMDAFRTLHTNKNLSDTTKIINNHRPVQHHNGRIVRSSFDASAGVSIFMGNVFNLIAVVLIGYFSY